MLLAGGRAVKTNAYHAVIFYQYRAYIQPATGGLVRHQFRHFNK